MNTDEGEDLLDSLVDGNFSEMKEVLHKTGLDINSRIFITYEITFWTPLYYSVCVQNFDLFSCIIGDPEFAPSPKALSEVFSLVCHDSKTNSSSDKPVSFNSAIKLNMFRDLINHPKVELEKIFDYWDRSVLFHVVVNNKIDYLKELIAVGKVYNQSKTCHFHHKSDKSKLLFLTPEVIANKTGLTEIAKLLRDLRKSPLSTTQRIRLELKDKDALSANLFCCVVLLCDEFFTVKPKTERPPNS